MSESVHSHMLMLVYGQGIAVGGGRGVGNKCTNVDIDIR